MNVSEILLHTDIQPFLPLWQRWDVMYVLAIILDPSSEGQTWAQETFVCYWSTKAAGQVLDGPLGRSLVNTWWHLTESLIEIFALFKVYSPTKHLQVMES